MNNFLHMRPSSNNGYKHNEMKGISFDEPLQKMTVVVAVVMIMMMKMTKILYEYFTRLYKT